MMLQLLFKKQPYNIPAITWILYSYNATTRQEVILRDEAIAKIKYKNNGLGIPPFWYEF
jgi:hypothetical protein